MWFAERRPLQAALLEDRVIVCPAAARGAPAQAQVLPLPAAVAGAKAWDAPVRALTQWLREHASPGTRLQLFLSGDFVRWQLLDWPPTLASPDEVDAYARLRFRTAFGATADDWQLSLGPLLPGQPLPACAIDQGLLRALEGLQTDGVARVHGATPYFAAAFDRWRRRVGRQTAWFGVAEPGHLTLGLLHRGRWRGLRSCRLPRDSQAAEAVWGALVPPLQAQMGVSSGLELPAQVPLYLAGCFSAPKASAWPGLVWLAPEGDKPTQGVERMAWGV